eukprot:1038026-Prorocentrum_lima.AAC.1
MRALQSKTRTSVQAVNYQIGDQVEFWRAPANNDLSGWCGPAVVVSVQADGNIYIGIARQHAHQTL